MKTLTTEKFLSEYPVSGYDEGDYCKADVERFMVEFAKIHVKAALKAFKNKAEIHIVNWCNDFTTKKHEIYDGDGDKNVISIDENSIIEAYPLSNIK